MNIRNRALSEGWYPSSEDEIRGKIATWKLESWGKPCSKGGIAGIVPHAGWTFCGSMIVAMLDSLRKNLDTVVVLGGHIPPGGPLIEYVEDIWNLPSGGLKRDVEFMALVDRKLPKSFNSQKEMSVDNTVEVIIPLIGVMYPEVKWAAWRLPADSRAMLFGEILAHVTKKIGKKIAVIGSTDLTHYGPNYGFTPRESMVSPLDWVKQRDQIFLEALAGFEGKKALELAQTEQSACSAGAATGAMTYAQKYGCNQGHILHYSTSGEMYPSSSFVGYGSIIWGTS